ncbi:DUF1854 domain-containing protein [Alcaligenaceae bacterium CGII-47]|nr:DUF1854 domain-containing protein [Alcaligenaceae bacterium CGII-47]
MTEHAPEHGTATAPIAPDFGLSRDAFGRLILTRGRARYESVMPVRSFPITAPNEGIALVGLQGTELAWIERPDDLPPAIRELIAEELASREFIPEIQRILSVSTFATPSVWELETDRGRTQLTLKAEEDIRHLAASALLIADRNGIQFLIRDTTRLDVHSKRLLERFL